MLAHVTGTPITICEGSVPLCFQPGWLVKSHPMVVRRGARTYDSLVGFCREHKPRWVCVHRTYALGDVIMLLPVLRALRRAVGLTRPVILATGSWAHRGLGGLVGDGTIRLVKSMGIRGYGADIHIDLDHCLEADHRGGEESSTHRMELYGKALGLC